MTTKIMDTDPAVIADVLDHEVHPVAQLPGSTLQRWPASLTG
jgi:hypothetical protein